MTKRIPLLFLCLLWLSPTNVQAADPDADRAFTFAVRLMQTGETELAAEALQEFVRKHTEDPRVGDARYYLALVERSRGNLGAAQTQLAKITKAHQVTDAMLHLLRGQVAIEAGDAKTALTHLEKVDPKQLTDAEARAGWSYLVGVAYRATGNLTGAAERFDKATEAESAIRGPALVELGKVRVELKQPAAALEALTAATNSKLDPALAAEARKLAADVAYSLKQYPKAADLYRKVVQQHQTSPQFGPAVVGVLRSLYAADKPAQVIAEYKAVERLLPQKDEAEALYLLGAAHVRSASYAQGALALKRFYERFGADHALAPQVGYMYAVCLYHTDPDGYEKWFARVEPSLKSMPHAAELRYLRAQGAVKKKQYEPAIAYLTPLVDGDKGKGDYAKQALIQRAALYEQVGNSARAAADYQLYIERYGADAAGADAGRRAIDLAFAGGDYKRVIELAGTWLKGDKLDPEVSASIRLKLALALIKLKQNDRAAAVLDELIKSKPNDQIAALTRFYRGLLLAAAAKPTGPNGDTTKPAIAALEKAMTGPLPPAQQGEALDLIARLHRIADRPGPALDVYKKLRERRPIENFDAPTAVWVGRGLYRRGEPREALPWLANVAARKQAPINAIAEALFLSGSALGQLGDHDAAIASYRRLVALSHGYGDRGRLGLARSLAATDNAEEALNEYNGLLVVEGTDTAAAAWYESAVLLLDRAATLRRAGDTEDADRARTEAVRRLNRVAIQFDLKQLEPLPTRALLTLGRLAIEDKANEKARGRFEAVTKRHETGPWHEAGKAELLLIDGKRGEAVFLVRKILKATDAKEAAAWAADRLKSLGEN